ncbi:MAG: hypothetical protein WBP85_00135 [Terracidiphilus sp.]
MVNLERRDCPGLSFERETIEVSAVAGWGVSQTSGFEERRSCPDRLKNRRFRKLICRLANHLNLCIAVGGGHLQRYPPAIICNSKLRAMMLARKKPAASHSIQDRSRIPSADINAGMNSFDIVPLDSDTMSGIFALEAEHRRNVPRPYFIETDQTDSCDSITGVQFWAKRRRQISLHHLGINSKVNK